MPRGETLQQTIEPADNLDLYGFPKQIKTVFESSGVYIVTKDGETRYFIFDSQVGQSEISVDQANTQIHRKLAGAAFVTLP